MKERPILFNGDMVQAILSGQKVQTRRPIKPQPSEMLLTYDGEIDSLLQKCPFGQPGDRLWVRETWGINYNPVEHIVYKERDAWMDSYSDQKWRPSIHMPRQISRILLEIDEIKVERVQDITEDGARAEGAENEKYLDFVDWANSVAPPGSHIQTLVEHFAAIWDGCYRREEFDPMRFDANPWVWVVKFHQI
jgi:hypothetical protein